MAGCSTPPERTWQERAPDWEDTDLAQTTPAYLDVPAPAAIAPQSPMAPRFSPPPVTWVDVNHWAEQNRVGVVHRVAGTALPAFELRTANGVMLFHTGSLSARWDGVEIRLGFAPQWMNGRPFLHALDVVKTVEPLVSSPARLELAGRTVVIDAGHGGVDSGTQSVLGHGDEKDFALDWARRLAPLLAAQGWRVLLTRTNDIDMSLAERVAFAERHNADLFVSLHFNSVAPSREQSGLETYCLTPAGMPSTVTRGYVDDVGAVFPNNAFDEENLQYAVRLHRALLAVNGNRDRGVRRARFLGVLRWQNRPAVLIEGGYLSNPAEARLIADPLFRQRLAEAVAAGLQ